MGCTGRKYNNRRYCVSRFIFGSVDAAGQLCNAGHLFIQHDNYGKHTAWKADASDEEVIEAAKKAYCHEFIITFENGYNTSAGDDGAKLSGGQRQRIIIARALLRNAPILILDEATAYADMENQHKIQKSLEELCKDKTLIVIAHRLSTVTGCDQIIVMNNGTVAATGTHGELLKQSPLYAKLWDTHEQSRNWKLERGKGE